MNELLQELRVILPGVQVLFAFLLTVAFTQRFTELDPYLKDIYFTALLSTAFATPSSSSLRPPSIGCCGASTSGRRGCGWATCSSSWDRYF